jgi:hypothetical protein
MPIYLIPGNESRIRKLLKARRWLLIILPPLLLVLFCLLLTSRGRVADLYRVLSIGSVVALVNLWDPFRRQQKIVATLSINSIEIEPGGVRLHWKTWSKFIARDEIVRVEEPPEGRGMYIRTAHRFQWYLIPRYADHYQEIKGEMAAMGIPIVANTAAPANWGVLFSLLFCASLVCDVLTRDRGILIANLALALILAGTGAALMRRFIEDPPFRRTAVLGSFIPAIFSAVSLIYPFGIR